MATATEHHHADSYADDRNRLVTRHVLPQLGRLRQASCHLQAELVRYGIERGDATVNFSPGPNVSKTRWSEALWVTTHEFAFGAGPRSLDAPVSPLFNSSACYGLR